MTQSQSPPAGPLNHIRILDLSRILAGPWAAQTLADLGADVVKVESPAGDDTRGWGPPFLPGPDGAEGDGRGDAAYFTTANRNKRSLVIDFAKPAGADLVCRLVQDCDVLIENFKLGGLAKYGLDYDSLKEINPALIYCSITGFGQDGPYAHRPGYDFMIQGMGGLMSVTGQPGEGPGGGPVKVGVAVSDLFTGMYAAVSILAALNHRDRTGEGQHIDCALLDTQVAMLANQASNWLVGGVVPGRMGNNHPNVAPYRVYPVADGHIIIACGNDRQFARLCATLGDEALAGDPRFATNGDRITNRDALDARIEELLTDITHEDVLARLEAAGVPGGPINDVEQIFADPHVQARGLASRQSRPDGQPIATVAYPARLSRTPASYRRAPPALGADTADVLIERLQLTEAELQALSQAGVIG